MDVIYVQPSCLIKNKLEFIHSFVLHNDFMQNKKIKF